jgi:hypothetical protein
MADNSNPPGSMQSWPLLVTHALEYAARWHKDQEIICKTVEGPITISTYAGKTTAAADASSASSTPQPGRFACNVQINIVVCSNSTSFG